jgi:hypothetical protein
MADELEKGGSKIVLVSALLVMHAARAHKSFKQDF